MARKDTAIYEAHAKKCPASTVKARKAGAKCNCTPTFQVKVWSNRDRKRLSKTFSTKTEAKRWQAEAKTEVHKGTRRAPSKKTIGQALDELVAGMKDGSVRSSYGTPYKAGSIQNYELDAANVWGPAIGGCRVGAVERSDIQHVIDDRVRQGFSGPQSRITST